MKKVLFIGGLAIVGYALWKFLGQKGTGDYSAGAAYGAAQQAYWDSGNTGPAYMG